MKSTTTPMRFMIGAVFVCVAACANEDSSSSSDRLTEEITEACKHLNNGEALPMDVSEMPGVAPSIHARYELTLGGESMSFDGSINFTSMGGRHALFLTKAASIDVTNSSDETLTPLDTLNGSDACPEAATIVIIDLPADTYAFTIFGAIEADIEFTVHAFNASHDHGHGHGDDHGH